MKALERFAVLFATAVGLAVAFVPTAGAMTVGSGPVTHVVRFATSDSIASPCDGSTVTTRGHDVVTTTTIRQHTAVTVANIQSADGYEFVEVGRARFDSVSSSYSVPTNVLWIDFADLAKSFHASFTEVVYVNSQNAATGATDYLNSIACGF